MKGVRFLKNGAVVKVFMDDGWRERALQAGLIPGKDYQTLQVLKGSGGFDTWVNSHIY